ncbi:D-alanyl-D-alanine dipeptidase [Dulcicalothrix desertica PCC 7102]|uniref:D-alanyl-D-alanine dipeptidase n=1 Tax=Dulcicalothrix desertica PCC 7102 TaxID=232991 RepID=A0A3S5K3F0_9CYAN|nr:M15 family metallopeptidase [Dulcicalothrix desertica]RUT07099.1 D-alanyl-D-alanine dipeptidase [Dulcicalothrix desertica PCC 7102]TWH61905.1 D-alanyl-D-alanine dipeptidase [Dulcicalothrix desertica PCC 7102]
MRPYNNIPIIECNEPLVKIPLENFAVETPHPYEKLGAPYGQYSPYFLRQSVIDCLIEAQNYLQQKYPNWQIQIFDAYRPVAVQQFMVDYSFTSWIQQKKLIESDLTPTQRQQVWEEVYKIWAVPSLDMKTPPPHSTGAALDVTLVNENQEILDMGSPIDEMSDRSLPNYYDNNNHCTSNQYHSNRKLLCEVMEKAGFHRNPREWWHFSYGDQMWAWQHNEKNPNNIVTAKYGRLATDYKRM